MKRFAQYLNESSRGWEVVPYSDSDSSFQSHHGTDSYYYHVTLKPNVSSILRNGLIPAKKPLMGRYGGYQSNSAGRVFLTDRNGVFYWVERAELHAEDKYDNPPDVAVLRIPKAALAGITVTPDDIGTRDAHAPAWYVTGAL